MRHITPKGIRPPFARYSYGVEIPPGYRILVCSGQLGIDPADRVPTTVEEQTQLCFRNIEAVLKEGPGLRMWYTFSSRAAALEGYGGTDQSATLRQRRP